MITPGNISLWWWHHVTQLPSSSPCLLLTNISVTTSSGLYSTSTRTVCAASRPCPLLAVQRYVPACCLGTGGYIFWKHKYFSVKIFFQRKYICTCWPGWRWRPRSGCGWIRQAWACPPWTNQRWALGHVTSLHQPQLTWTTWRWAWVCPRRGSWVWRHHPSSPPAAREWTRPHWAAL